MSTTSTAATAAFFVEQHPQRQRRQPDRRSSTLFSSGDGGDGGGQGQRRRRRHASSSTAPRGRSSSSSSPRGGGGGRGGRNRRLYDLRTSGVKTKRSRVKPPRWETEGDALYDEIVVVGDGASTAAATEADGGEWLVGEGDDAVGAEMTEEGGRRLGYAAAKRLLRERLHSSSSTSETETDKEERRAPPPRPTPTMSATAPTTTTAEKKTKAAPPHTLWGPLPVGPVLANRLRSPPLSLAEPTPIQTAAFPVLSSSSSKRGKKRNAILAGATGTGKTLAYLLPIICGMDRSDTVGNAGSVLIVCPTFELASQIGRVVDGLWPLIPVSAASNEDNDDDGAGAGGAARSVLHVVGTGGNSSADNQKEDEEEEKFPLLRAAKSSPFLAGTPKALRALLAEVRDILNPQYNFPARFDPAIAEARAVAKAIQMNVRTVVLDEADRLLRTESTARSKRAAAAAGAKTGGNSNRRRDNVGTSPTELLLTRDVSTILRKDLLSDLQIICASATVGRTLRTQLMNLLDAPSADAAATLVTAIDDARTAKGTGAEGKTKRRQGLMPMTLRHAYRLLPSTATMAMTTTTTMENKDARDESAIDELCFTLKTLLDGHPAPTLVFPGRIGVERVSTGLTQRGFRDVRTLRDLASGRFAPTGGGNSEDAAMTTTAVTAADAGGYDDDKKKKMKKKWEDMTLYVVGERFGRGLDLPNLGYVVLLSPPSSPAGYAHLAGRTGRAGRTGTAITLLRPHEVGRLIAIGQALGLTFSSLEGDDGDDDHEETRTPVGNVDGEKPIFPWAVLTEAALRRKTNIELSDYLDEYGVSVASASGGKVRKADLVAAVHALHGS